jgi:hypothetical protein
MPFFGRQGTFQVCPPLRGDVAADAPADAAIRCVPLRPGLLEDYEPAEEPEENEGG